MELLDINGLYVWDNTIFDNMLLPSDVVKADLIDMILYECRELTVTVVSPKIIKRAIELWSKKNYYYWSELQKTMKYSYNPIENYDRRELTIDTFSNNGTSRTSGETKTTEKGNTTNVLSGSKTTTNVLSGTKTTTDALTRAAYDSNTELPRETHTITETPTEYTTTVTETPTDYTTTETPNLTTSQKPDLTNTDENKGNNKHESYVHGNIGVMSTQQMITAQREVIDISLYNIIVNSFKNEFCILKY